MIFYDAIKTYLFDSTKGVIPNIDYYAQYESKVISQSSDNLKVDIQPVKPNIPGISNVPIRIGVAGITIQLVTGALVMLGFDGANPAAPFVTSFRNEDITSITIKDQGGDSIVMGSGSLVFKSNNTTIIDASISALKLGLIGNLAVFVQGTTDSLGFPCTNNPIASATIVKAGQYMPYTPSAKAQAVASSAGNNMANLPTPNTIWQSGIAAGNLTSAAMFDALQTSNTYIEIGSGGSAPAFTNSWVNNGAGTNTAAFFKDACGIVRLKGTIKSGIVGDVAFTLPTGYLPPGESIFAVISNSSVGRVDITTGGAVTPISPSNNTYVSLDGISFLATG